MFLRIRICELQRFGTRKGVALEGCTLAAVALGVALVGGGVALVGGGVTLVVVVVTWEGVASVGEIWTVREVGMTTRGQQ